MWKKNFLFVKIQEKVFYFFKGGHYEQTLKNNILMRDSLYFIIM